MRLATLLALVVSGAIASPAFAEDDAGKGAEKTKLLVLDFSTQDDRIHPSALTTMSGLAAAHLSGVSRFDVISSAEVKSIVELEGEKQALGCEEDTSCLAEVASAMGARLIVIGQMGKLGSLFILNVSLFDSDEAKTVSRRSVKANNLDQLAVALEPALDQMASEFFGETVAAENTTTTAEGTKPVEGEAVVVGGGASTTTKGGGDAAVKETGGGFRAGLASAAAGVGAGIGYGVGLFLGLSTQLGAETIIWPGDGFGTAMTNNFYAAGFTYLGTVVGAAYFNDTIGANVTGAVTGAATFLGVLGAWGIGSLVTDDPEDVTPIAVTTGAVVGITTAAVLTPLLLVEPDEAAGNFLFKTK